MCAQFILKQKANDLARPFGVQLTEKFVNYEFDLRVQGFLKTQEAPVIAADEKGILHLKMMKFSLCPSWSKEYPCTFSTYNARMERPKKGAKNNSTERIYEVPTWRESFVNAQTCLVPMNAAIESSYFGKSEGKMIRFIQNNFEIYYAAGLWSSWVNKLTGEVHDTFTLITDDPDPFFFDHGHDRSILVLAESKYNSWLLDRSLAPMERFQLLRNHRISLNWDVEVDREMKPGWQKRAPTTEEIAAIHVWGRS